MNDTKLKKAADAAAYKKSIWDFVETLK